MSSSFPGYFFTGIIASILLFPLTFSFAETCSSSGYTVIFVNGIFNTEKEAKQAEKDLKHTLPSQLNREQLTIRLG
jgi:hypothetical protein